MGYYLAGIWTALVWWPFMFLLGCAYWDRRT